MNRIALIGMKSSGKTTVGRLLAARLAVEFIDLDRVIEQAHTREHGERLPFRTIFRSYGAAHFRQLELAALARIAAERAEAGCVLATGGGTPLDERRRALLRELGIVIFLDVDAPTLLPRIVAGGIPAFFPYPDDPARSLQELLAARRPLYTQAAHLTLACGADTPEQLVEQIVALLSTKGVPERPSPL